MMTKEEHNNPTHDGCVERIAVKSELRNIVEHYSKLLDMITSSHQAKPATKAVEESPLIKND